jgi:hypothetical protein
LWAGKSIAVDLHNIGVPTVADVKGKDLKKHYKMSNRFAGKIQDRCLLYVFTKKLSCFAKNHTHNPKKLT